VKDKTNNRIGMKANLKIAEDSWMVVFGFLFVQTGFVGAASRILVVIWVGCCGFLVIEDSPLV
jgi:hypothetical protein